MSRIQSLHQVAAWVAPIVVGLALAYQWTVNPWPVAAIATTSAAGVGVAVWVVTDYRQLQFRRRWARLLLEYRDAAATAGRGLDELRDAVLALHRPWYVDAHGARVEHRVYITVEDPADLPPGHECVTEIDLDRGHYDVCEPEEGEHQVLACYECRQATDDGDPGYLLWPCSTAHAVGRDVLECPACQDRAAARALRQAAPVVDLAPALERPAVELEAQP